MKRQAVTSLCTAFLLHVFLIVALFNSHEPARFHDIADDRKDIDVSLLASEPPSTPSETPALVPPEPPPPMPQVVPPPAMPVREISQLTATDGIQTATLPEIKPSAKHHAEKNGSKKSPQPTAAKARSGTDAGSISKPHYRRNPPPDYPDEARRRHQEGVVLLHLEIGADGRVAAVALKRSSGYPLLDMAAMQAARRWTFEPARTAGLPVASRVDVPVRFSISQ